jgi:micrococcal nuclease
MRSSLTLLLFVALQINFGCNPVRNQSTTNLYAVKKVVDGDTFWVDDGSEKGFKVRLIGVDAPETHKSAHKEIGYYGTESSGYLCRLISGKKVRLLYDVEKVDQYKRTLAYVYLEDGTFVNAELLKNGYARVLTIPPNVLHATEFLRLQRKARRLDKGLWCNSEKY